MHALKYFKRTQLLITTFSLVSWRTFELSNAFISGIERGKKGDVTYVDTPALPFATPMCLPYAVKGTSYLLEVRFVFC